MALAPNLLLAAAVAAAPVAPPSAATALVVLEVNGAAAAEPVLVRREGADFLVPVGALEPFRIELAGLPVRQVDGVAHVSLAALGITARFDEVAQRLALTAPARLFAPTVVALGGAETVPMTRSGTGAFLNYEISALLGDEPGASGSAELGVFSGNGFGTATAIWRWSPHGASLVRLDSGWTFDDVGALRSLRLGDAVSRPGAGAVPVRFAGIQFGRAFAIDPAFVTLPVPTLSGSAALPSAIDLYVDGRLAARRAVPAGPFTFTEAPVTAGEGRVSAVVRDAFGRETVISARYQVAPTLLRAGLSDFGIEAGFLRRFYGVRSFAYGAPFAAATWRRGMGDRLTLEVHAEVTDRLAQAGAAADVAVPGFGFLGVTASGSYSAAGAGAELAARFERRVGGYSLGAAATLATDAYRSAGSDRHRLPRTSVQVFAGAPIPSGSVAASLVYRSAGPERPRVALLGAHGTLRLGRLGTLQASVRHDLAGTTGSAAELGLSMPLGGYGSASVAARQEDGRRTAYASVQRPLPTGEGWGYRAEASLGERDRFAAHLAYNGAFGEYEADLAYDGGRAAARLSAAGSIGTLGGDVFAARPLTQSFAVVTVEGGERVRVYADNHPVGRTDAKGKLVIPSLRPYEANRLRLELADLPIDAAVTDGARTVRPYGRSGVAVRFDARRRRGAVVRIEIEPGVPLPTGSRVTLAGREFLTAPGGQVYLEGVEPRNRAEAAWEGGRCTVTFEAPPTDDPQPDLGTLSCGLDG